MATSPTVMHSSAARTATTGQTSLQQLQRDLIDRANKNEHDAAFRLGVAYTLGHFGFSVDYKEAQKYLKIAAKYTADESDIDANIRRCAEAFCLQYRNKLTEAFAKEIFGVMYPQNPDNYAGDYASGSTKGYIPAKFLYSLFGYEIDMKKNEFLPEDIQSLLEDTRACVAQRFTPAIGLLGIFTCKGIGMPANPEEGIRLLKEAADAGDGPSKLHLAQVYHFFLYGQEKNLKQAKIWYTKADEQKIPGAQGCLELLKKSQQCVLL